MADSMPTFWRTGCAATLGAVLVLLVSAGPGMAGQLPPPPPLPTTGTGTQAPPPAQAAPPPATPTAPANPVPDPTAITQAPGGNQPPALPPIDPSGLVKTTTAPGVPGKIDQVIFVGYDLNPTQQQSLNDLSQAAQTAGAQSTALFANASNPDELINAMQSAVGLAANTIPTGGGGAPVLPGIDSTLPVILAAGLLGASSLLVIAIVVVRKRAPSAPVAAHAAGPRVNAGLAITFANGTRATVRITGARTTIGRAPDSTLVLDDSEASAHHAEILVSREGFRLRDAGSSNGTTVNGQGVTDVYISLGDEIGIGTTTLTLTE